MNPTHPTSQPPPAALSQCWSCPRPHTLLLNPGQGEDLKKVSAEADVLFCSCRTLKPQWRMGMMGTSPTCQHCAASPRHRWAPLFQQRTRGEENTSPSSAAVGSQPVRPPGAREASKAPGPRAFGRVRARVRALTGELARMKGGK